MKKIAVYTAITNNKDTLKDRQVKGGADFICFTDNKNLKSNIWTMRPACSLFSDNNRNAKIHKILSHQYMKDYEYTIWIDANIYLEVEPEYLIEKYLADSDIALFKHFEGRKNIYDEAAVCIRHNLDNADLIKEQTFRYQKNGYKNDNGIFENTIILRKNTPQVEKLNNYWWSEICRYSKRDQISFGYTIDKLKIKPAVMEGHIKDNKYFKRVAHDGHTIRKSAINKSGNPTIVDGMVKVIMNKSTLYERKQLKAGQQIVVPNKVAQRWSNMGLAYFSNWDDLFDSDIIPNDKYIEHEKVSIIIPVADQLQFVKKCIESVYKYTQNFELIIIDNNSKKETEDYLRFLPDIIYQRNDENKGVPYAWNQGIKLAKYDYICFLNSDTIMSVNWLGKLMKVWSIKKDCGSVGPTTSYAGNAQCNRTIERFRYAMDENKINQFSRTLDIHYHPYDLMGFAFVVKREVFDKVGVFDYKTFKLGCTEEREFQWRAKKLGGYQSYWATESYVHHFGHATFKGLNIDPYRYNSEVRKKWEADKGKVMPKFIKNDVEININD